MRKRDAAKQKGGPPSLVMYLHFLSCYECLNQDCFIYINCPCYSGWFVDNYPTINLSKHCGLIGNPAYPKLLLCEQFVKAAIKTCRTNKKRVYISLGGATKTYGLESEEKAKIFAKRVWDLFLGGKDNVRPFGEYVRFFYLSFSNIVLQKSY